MGIASNEAADTLAEEALRLPPPSKFLLPVDDLSRAIDRFYCSTWQQRWTSTQATAYGRIKPQLGPSVREDLPRRSQVAILRLRLQTCQLSHGHHITKTPHAQCAHCAVNLSIQHVLLDCPRFSVNRGALFSSCAALHLPANVPSLLSAEIPPEVLITYLTECDILRRL
jgi:hypothetical protein